MRGSIKKRGATWSYVVDCGRDPITGRRRQVYKRGFANRKAAEAALSEALSEMNRGEFVRPNTATLAGYLTQ
jgi:Arm DNA-binding domain